MEDMNGTFSVIVFPDLYRDTYSIIQGDDPLCVKGRLDASEESTKVIALEITTLEEATKKPFSSVHFMIDAAKSDENDIELLKTVLEKYKGNYKGYIHLTLENKSEAVFCLGERLKFDISEGIKREVDNILGSGATKFM
jgi:DNA polymerase III alpha subunit